MLFKIKQDPNQLNDYRDRHTLFCLLSQSRVTKLCGTVMQSFHNKLNST
jgi:hypothetical protein